MSSTAEESEFLKSHGSRIGIGRIEIGARLRVRKPDRDHHERHLGQGGRRGTIVKMERIEDWFVALRAEKPCAARRTQPAESPRCWTGPSGIQGASNCRKKPDSTRVWFAGRGAENTK